MIHPSLEWLPERHLDTVSTLAHSDELIEQVGNLQYQYLSQDAGVIGLKEVPGGIVTRTTVDYIAPIPKKIQLLVADAIGALRAAVEHTLFAEVEFLNGAPLDGKAAISVEMPACLESRAFDLWVNNRNRPVSLQGGGELVRRIRGLQPFHRDTGPELHPLARLASHSNHSKHRKPAITAVRLVTMIRDDESPQSFNEVQIRDELPLQVGDVIAETPYGVRVPASLFPSIGINRPGTDEWPILMRELDEISSWVRTQAIPRLIAGDAQPQAELPPRYDISVGHDDVREAISLGSTVSANERIQIRMGAASARESLVELLQFAQGEIDPKLVTGWLSSLTDEDVLERVARLKAAPTADGGAVQANMAVLHDLREEVLTSARDRAGS